MDWLKNLLFSDELASDLRFRLDAWRRLPVPDLTAPHLQTRYVVVDVETSGAGSDDDRLIAVGAVAVDRGLIRADDAFDIVLRQRTATDADNILAHGIGASEQLKGVEPGEALIRFLEYQRKAPLVGYRTDYLQDVFSRTFRLYLGAVPELIWHDLDRIRHEDAAGVEAVASGETSGNGRGDRRRARHGGQVVLDALAAARRLQIELRRGPALGLKSSHEYSVAERSRRSLRRQ